MLLCPVAPAPSAPACALPPLTRSRHIFEENRGPPPCIESGDFRLLEAVWRDSRLWLAASAGCRPGSDDTVQSCLHLIGVADCDGAVTSVDAALILQLNARLIASLRCPHNADANRDGIANALDAALILQLSAGLLTGLP